MTNSFRAALVLAAAAAFVACTSESDDSVVANGDANANDESELRRRRHDAGPPTPDAAPDTGTDAAPDAAPPPVPGPKPAYCATNPWSGLEACGWPGPKNTGFDLSQCPNGKLTDMGSSAMPTIEVNKDNTVLECVRVTGSLHITAKNVTIRNSYVSYDSGKRGEAANGTSVISVEEGASATIDHVEINGFNGVHACIWHSGTSMTARAVNCYGINDGIFSWADTNYSLTTGDNFTIEDSYFHDFTHATANGHIDGYQTEGANNGVIRHNTYAMGADANSAIAIWNDYRSSNNFLIENNLLEGGGATVYASDISPSGSPVGGNTLTNVVIKNNVFSTHVAPCVGQYFVWYARPAEAYGGGPTDGWHRSGNVVLETGENVDNGNPHVNGWLCQ